MAFGFITDAVTAQYLDSSEVVSKESKQGSGQVFWFHITNMPVADGNITDTFRHYDTR